MLKGKLQVLTSDWKWSTDVWSLIHPKRPCPHLQPPGVPVDSLLTRGPAEECIGRMITGPGDEGVGDVLHLDDENDGVVILNL